MCHTKGDKYQHWCGPGAFAHGFPHFIGKIARHVEECMGKFGSWVPYNLEDREDGYLITVLLPGRTKEDVTVSLIGNSLNVKASKPKTEDVSGQQRLPFLRFFFTFIDVDMDIPLPANADVDSIKSVMANGLLKVKIGKKPSKKINVNDAGNN
jgi:HSP20 family molecular chaperone IbpA